MVEDKKLARALSLDWAGIKSNGLKDAGLFPFIEKLFVAELRREKSFQLCVRNV